MKFKKYTPINTTFAWKCTHLFGDNRKTVVLIEKTVIVKMGTRGQTPGIVRLIFNLNYNHVEIHYCVYETWNNIRTKSLEYLST